LEPEKPPETVADVLFENREELPQLDRPLEPVDGFELEKPEPPHREALAEEKAERRLELALNEWLEPPKDPPPPPKDLLPPPKPPPPPKPRAMSEGVAATERKRTAARRALLFIGGRQCYRAN
jgi:hypothetical protein